MPFKS